MDDLIAVMIAAFLGFVLGLVFGVGAGGDTIKRDCEKMGQARIGNQVLICEKK